MPATSLQSAYCGFSITVAMIRQLISGYSSRAVSSLKALSVEVMRKTSIHPNIPPPRRTLRETMNNGRCHHHKRISGIYVNHTSSVFFPVFRVVCALQGCISRNVLPSCFQILYQALCSRWFEFSARTRVLWVDIDLHDVLNHFDRRHRGNVGHDL